MKRLGVYIVVMIGCLFVGLTTYYMVKNYEIIDISAETIENTIFINVGQTTSLNVVHELKQTELSYSVNEEGVITYNVETGEITGLSGGDVELVIISENTKYGDNGQFKFNVKVGDGTQASPYYILNKDDLKAIGSTRTYENGNSRAWDASAFYQLRSDIDLAGEEWEPLCAKDGFSGSFVGGNSTINTISNLTITSSQQFAGLFAGLTDLAEISFISFKNPKIIGNFDFAGVVAGIAQDSKISKISVQNGTVLASPYEIEQTRATALVGGIVGATMGTIVANNMSTALSQRGSVYMCSYQGVVGTAESIKGDLAGFEGAGLAVVDVGGIVGYMFGSTIQNNKAEVTFSINKEIADIAANFNRDLKTGICIDVGGIVGAIDENMVASSGGQTATIYPIVKDNLAILNINNKPTTAKGVVGQLPINIHFSGTVEGTNQWVIGNYYHTNSALIAEGGSVISNATTAISDAAALKNIKTYVSMPGTPWNITDEEGISSPWLMLDGNTSPVINYLYQDVTLPVDEEIITISSEEEFYKVYYNMTSLDISDIARKYYLMQSYKLETDIDLSKILDIATFQPIGSGKYMFNGSFDGNGYTISFGSKTLSGDENNMFGGLFGQIGSNAEVKNLTVSNLTLSSFKYAGAIAGVNYGKITNCVVTDILIENSIYAGGFAGINKGTISTEEVGQTETDETETLTQLNSTIEIQITNVTNTTFTGGIAGLNYGVVNNITIESIIFGQDVYTGDIVKYIGGMVGYNYNNAKIINCYVSGGQIIDQSTIAVYIGGFAGINEGEISRCGVGYSAGGISINITAAYGEGKQVVGGFAAMISNKGKVTQSFANVKVEARVVGGFAAYLIGEVSESYVIGSLNGLEVGGFAVYMALTSGSTEGGHIINSYTAAGLTAYNDSAKLAGLCLYMRYPSVIEKCYSACTFEGNGEAYYESLTNTREGFLNWVTSWARPNEKLGTITNVVINETGGANKTTAVISYNNQNVIYLQGEDVINPLNYDNVDFSLETIWRVGGPKNDIGEPNSNKNPILYSVDGLHGVYQNYGQQSDNVENEDNTTENQTENEQVSDSVAA